jgi:iron complex outermembrane receptor protein
MLAVNNNTPTIINAEYASSSPVASYPAIDNASPMPRFSVISLGSQHLFNNQTGAPDAATMPSYTTANLSFTASPLKFVNLSASFQNLSNKKYNEYDYISSGGYFGTTNAGYILAYPGAPLSTYGTVSFQF